MQLKNITHSFDVNVGEVGFTVRKGRKWFETSKVGDILDLWNCQMAHLGKCTDKHCSFCGQAEVVYITLENFKYLTPELLMFEHNKDARDYDILKKQLIRAYGKFDDNDIVTLLFYKRLTKGVTLWEQLKNFLTNILK